MKKHAWIASALLLVLAALPARAEVSGAWFGQIHFVSSDGDDEMWDCNIAIYREADTLFVDDPDACTYTPEYLTPFEVRGTELYYEGALWGALEETRVDFSTNDDFGVWDLEFTLQDEGSLALLETYDDGEGYSDRTDGVLPPKEEGRQPRPARPHADKKARRLR
jgi:hypothetical protein